MSHRLSGAKLTVLYLRADLATGKATVRSLAAIYAFGVGIMTGDNPAWREINTLLRDSRNGDARFVEQVKRAAWTIYDQAAGPMRAAREVDERDEEEW